MNRFKRRSRCVLGAMSTLVVAVIGVILPVGRVFAVGPDVVVSVEVVGQDFSAQFVTPTPPDNTVVLSPSGDGRVNYANADSLQIEMFTPLGNSEVVYDSPLGSPDGYVDFSYDLDDGYGEYTFLVTGEDIYGAQKTGQEITISYHSAYFEIVDETDEDGDPIVEVTFGPEVCGLSFQLYRQPEAPGATGVLEPPYSVLGNDFTSLPGFSTGTVKITIPLSQDPYNLPAGKYRVAMSTYDCSGNTLEEDLDAIGNGIIDYRGGSLTPPDVGDTGMVRIGGLSIARSDVIISVVGLSAFSLAVFFYRRVRKEKIQV